MAIRVLIADDHRVVAESLRHLLELQPDIEVVDCVADGREALRTVMRVNPDVVLMDNAMPNLNGVEATHLIRERSPATKVVMLSMNEGTDEIVRALRAGAAGYLPKRVAAGEVVEAIRKVHAGRRYLARDIADLVLARLTDPAAAPDPLAALSSRERQVLQLLAEGHSTAEIAESLSLSPRTVETYRARLMDKLELRDVASLVRFAIQRGIVSLD